MDSDVLVVGLIILGLLIATGIYAYLMATRRQKKYIVYVDHDGVKTVNGDLYTWNNLQKVHFTDKRVLGGGLATRNFALSFIFKGGVATIDINSNIYHHLYDIANKVQVPQSHTITKGLLRKST